MKNSKMDKKNHLCRYPGLSEKIRDIRGSLSQTEFGKLVGASQAQIGRIENGQIPGTDTLNRISVIGNTSVEFLLTGEGVESYPSDNQKNNGDYATKKPSGEEIRMLYQAIQELADLKKRIENLESQLSGKQKKNQPGI